MKKLKRLTFEEMEGTKTYYLPFDRGPDQQPRVTLVVRRVMEDHFHVGLAICSLQDNFCRLFGRRLAWNRLRGNPLTGNVDDLTKAVMSRLEEVSVRRDGPGRLATAIYKDTVRIFDQLTTEFDRLDQNREDLVTKAGRLDREGCAEDGSEDG